MITPTVHLSRILCWIGIVAYLPAPASNHPAKQAPSVFNQLYREEAVAVTLRTDLGKLLADPSSGASQDGVLEYASSGGAVSLPLEVSLRGRYRRRVCEFPPVKLKFERKGLLRWGLDTTFRSLKLVTHCSEGKQKGNEALLREYVAYRLFSMLTERSYRVQLLEITYVDSEGKLPELRRYGFFIEDTDEMAGRLGGKECGDCMNPQPEQLSPRDAAIVAVFQYMIGNSDWDPAKMRNLKMVQMSGEGKDILVPYDFDFSGLVNASYARPNPDMALRSVRDRILMGFPLDDPIMKWALNYTKFQKEELLKFVRRFRLLSVESRSDMLSYLDYYFTYLEEIQVNQATGLFTQLSATPLKYAVTGP